MQNRFLTALRAVGTAPFILFPLQQPSVSAAGEILLDRLEVTAPVVSAVPQERATTAVTEIGADDIQRQQIHRLDDALHLVPGVSLSGRQAPGGTQTLSIRGLAPRNTRVFIDGIEMSDTSQAQSHYPMGELDTADIDRIEVLRGPQPGRFGVFRRATLTPAKG